MGYALLFHWLASSLFVLEIQNRKNTMLPYCAWTGCFTGCFTGRFTSGQGNRYLPDQYSYVCLELEVHGVVA